MISYEGKKPYAYISFAPEDNALVTPVLEELSARGYRIWFDNGSELPEDKLAKLSKCTVMLAFVTPAYQDSTACRRELYYALDCNKPVLGIAPGDYAPGEESFNQIGKDRWVCRVDFSGQEAFVEEICRCPELARCKGKGSGEETGGKTVDVTPVLTWVKKNWRYFAVAAAAILLLLIGYRTIHFWTDASCTEAAVCKLCGKERAAASGHNWKVATCEKPRTCKKCGVTDGKALGHQWTAADCQSAAVCAVCGEKSGNKADHQWIPATCTAPQTCVACGEVSGTALGHQWQDATYDAPKTCTRCGKSEGDPLASQPVYPDEDPEDPVDVLQVGDTLWFGTWEQDGNTSNGKERIQWQVLDQEPGRVLVISVYALDCISYDTTAENVTWESSTLRVWLDDNFQQNAFSREEKLLIELVQCISDDNPDHGTYGGKDTWDEVFLLSLSEVMRYYPDSRDRVCEPTQYAVDRGAFSHADANRGCWWWLRTPGVDGSFVTSVNSNGSLDVYGSATDGVHGAVRPAMWIKVN